MDQRIKILVESNRGCGYRTKKGALYLMSDGEGYPCGALPIPLTVCPCCGHGIKPARGFTWVNLRQLMGDMPVCGAPQDQHSLCPLGGLMTRGLMDKVGLIWVGSKFYTLESFNKELAERGMSRRIPFVPNDFKVGETWVALAHREAILSPFEWGEEPEFTPGIFHLVKPSRIEVLCDGTETTEEIDRYIERGLSPVMVIKDTEAQPELEVQNG